MDSTHDLPSITALLMALELSSKPDSNAKFLGAITTSTEAGMQHHQLLLALSNLSSCLPIISVNETELYPVHGGVPKKLPDSVQFLLDSVAKYPGQISIYSSGSLAAVAMAEKADPTFASNVKEVVIVGNTYGGEASFDKDRKAVFTQDSPFLRDQEAFLQLLGGEIPTVRVMATSKPVLSEIEMANRVIASVKAETGSEDLSSRPLAGIYVHSHRSRIASGHTQAILMQEPGAAVLFDPSIIVHEVEAEFQMEPTLQIVEIDEKNATPGDSTRLIYEINEDKFWDLLVRVRSKDWSTFCQEMEGKSNLGEGMHDEL